MLIIILTAIRPRRRSSGRVEGLKTPLLPLTQWSPFICEGTRQKEWVLKRRRGNHFVEEEDEEKGW